MEHLLDRLARGMTRRSMLRAAGGTAAGAAALTLMPGIERPARGQQTGATCKSLCVDGAQTAYAREKQELKSVGRFSPPLGTAYLAYLLWLQYNVRGPGLCNRHCRGTGAVPPDWTSATPTPNRPIAGACGCATSFCCACPGGFACCPDQSCSCCGAPPAGDLCANCQSVGGKCCPGPGGALCACANPDLPCSRYGC